MRYRYTVDINNNPQQTWGRTDYIKGDITGNTWDTIKTQTKTNQLMMGNRKDHIRVRRQRQRKTKSDNSNLSFENHISHVTKTAFFHLRNIAKLRSMLSVSDAEKLVHAFMTSRLDYCNALLGGCPASSINKLQIVQNAAARVLTRSRKYDHIISILQSVTKYYLPIRP